MALAAQRTYTGSGIEPVINPGLALKLPVTLAVGTYAKGTVLGQVAGTGSAVNHTQTITFGGTPSGGTFTLSFNGQTTGNITWSGTAATLAANIQTALATLSNIGTGNVSVSSASNPVVTFQGACGAQEQPLLTATNSLTGSSPTITPAHTTRGKPADGIFVAYDDNRSDGGATADAILEYDVVVDTFGQHTLGTSANSADFGLASLNVPAWFTGIFKASDLVGIDSNGVADLGRCILGSTSALSSEKTLINVR